MLLEASRSSIVEVVVLDMPLAMESINAKLVCWWRGLSGG